MPCLTLEIVNVPSVISDEADNANDDNRDPNPAALPFLLALAMNVGDDLILDGPMHVDGIASLLVGFLRDGSRIIIVEIPCRAPVAS